MTGMLTAEGCRRRRDRLWSSLDPRPDAILLHSPRNLTYFSNYYASPFVFRSQNAGAMLLLESEGVSTILCDNLLQPYAEASHVDRVEMPVWYRSRESAPRRDELLMRSAVELLKRVRPTLLGIDGAVPAIVIEALREATPGLMLLDVGPTIHRLMRSKDADEVAVLRRSMDVAAAGFAVALAGIDPGMTELDAFEMVNEACMDAAGEPVIVYGDFAAGPNAEQGGGGPTNRVIEKDELFILDCSAIVHGYRGDFANTFVVGGGKPTGRQREMAAACLEAMEAGEAMLRPGAAGREVHAAVHGVFVERGMHALFPHHAGHGLGLGHPDPPYLVPESEDVLVEGDVVTLEPGLYERGSGGMRFERNYLVTAAGIETLTCHHIGLERGSG